MLWILNSKGKTFHFHVGYLVIQLNSSCFSQIRLRVQKDPSCMQETNKTFSRENIECTPRTPHISRRKENSKKGAVWGFLCLCTRTWNTTEKDLSSSTFLVFQEELEKRNAFAHTQPWIHPRLFEALRLWKANETHKKISWGLNTNVLFSPESSPAPFLLWRRVLFRPQN